MSDSILAAALSAITGQSVITYDDYRNKKLGEDCHYSELNQTSLYMLHLVGGEVPIDSNILSNFTHGTITVKSSTFQITVPFNPNDTVGNLKTRIYEKEGVLEDEQRLVFNRKQLQDWQTLKDYSIQKDSIIHLICRIRGGGFVALYLPENQLAPKFNFDFTNVKDKGKVFKRGDYDYKRPCGWNRIALNVLDKYEDNNWLGANRKRQKLTDCVPDEWPVSYHGTAKSNCISIAEKGYLMCKGQRFKYGHGIYSTPNIYVASHFATKFDFEGHQYKAVFQNRVNPNPESLIKINPSDTKLGEYWISKYQEDLRPYMGSASKEIINSIY